MTQICTRRQFLKTAAITAAAASMPFEISSSAAAADAPLSRVIVGSHSELVALDETIQPQIARAVIDEMLKELTGASAARDAWLKILPNLQPADVVGVKVNCINARHASRPDVVYALADSLIQSVDFNPNNIIIWDRAGRELKRAEYTINRSASGIRCFGTDHTGYDNAAAVDVGSAMPMHFSAILSQMCTHLINVPVLKDHSMAGVTLSLKNHYGSIDNPGACHGNGCDPYVANLNLAPTIREKTKLIVCDALFGIYHGGPDGAPQWINRQLLASLDPVALDYVGMTILDAQRRQNSLPPLAERVAYLTTAARLGLGANNPAQIARIDLPLG